MLLSNEAEFTEIELNIFVGQSKLSKEIGSMVIKESIKDLSAVRRDPIKPKLVSFEVKDDAFNRGNRRGNVTTGKEPIEESGFGGSSEVISSLTNKDTVDLALRKMSSKGEQGSKNKGDPRIIGPVFD